MEETHRARWGGGSELPWSLSTALLKSAHVHQPGSSQNPVLLGVLENLLHGHDWSNHWWFVLGSPSLWRGWISVSDVCGWLSQQPASILGSFQKSHCQHNKRHLCVLVSGNSKAFRVSVPGMRTKTKFIFLIKNHNITLGQTSILPNQPFGQSCPSLPWI